MALAKVPYGDHWAVRATLQTVKTITTAARASDIRSVAFGVGRRVLIVGDLDLLQGRLLEQHTDGNVTLWLGSEFHLPDARALISGFSRTPKGIPAHALKSFQAGQVCESLYSRLTPAGSQIDPLALLGPDDVAAYTPPSASLPKSTRLDWVSDGTALCDYSITEQDSQGELIGVATRYLVSSSGSFEQLGPERCNVCVEDRSNA